MNTCKSVTALALVLSTFASAETVPWKTYSSDNLSCGDAVVHIESICQDRDEGLVDRGSAGIIRKCRSAKMLITHNQNSIETKLPYIPESQRKNLEKQGYDFTGLMKNGQWSPFLLMCADKKKPLLLLSYITSGSAQLENQTQDSLIDQPVVTNLYGQFVDEKTTRKAISFINRKSNKTEISSVIVNGVYGAEEKSRKQRDGE